MDAFAQTRGADDLFDDDFTPISEPVIQNFNPQPQTPQRGRGGLTPRGRGTRPQDSLERRDRVQAPAKTPDNQIAPSPTERKAVEHAISPEQAPEQSEDAIPESPQIQFKPPTAVRGDRTATGGAPKPKLTEEELTARLAAAKLNNAKRAEAHRLAEADEASFHQREAHASQKRKEEGQAKRIMNMEREKNRLRKLGAQAGREWDEGKEEQDARQERSSQFRRGAYGGVVYDGGRNGVGPEGTEDRSNGYQGRDDDQDFQERRGGYRGRGRGNLNDRGRGRGRSRGRGGFNSYNNHDSNTPQAPPDPVADFPALPTTSGKIQHRQDKPPDVPLDLSADHGSWADEVQSAKSPDGAW